MRWRCARMLTEGVASASILSTRVSLSASFSVTLLLHSLDSDLETKYYQWDNSYAHIFVHLKPWFTIWHKDCVMLCCFVQKAMQHKQCINRNWVYFCVRIAHQAKYKAAWFQVHCWYSCCSYAICGVYISVDLSLVHNNDSGSTNVMSVTRKIIFSLAKFYSWCWLVGCWLTLATQD